MPEATDRKQPAQVPAQVPGDAESPPKSEQDRTARQAVTHTDRTEPTQSGQKDKKPA